MPLPCEIIVDPHLLCLPNPCTSEEQLEAFFDSLLKWKDLASDAEACTLFSRNALMALEDDNEYPYRHQLESLIAQFDLKFIDVKTVDDLVRGILNRAPSFEEHYAIDAVLIDASKFDILPSCFSARLKANSKKAFAELLTALSIARLMGGDALKNRSVFASSFCLCFSGRIDVKSQVHDVSFTTDGCAFLHQLPYDITDSIPLSLNYDDLLSQLGLLRVWNNCEDTTAARSAITMRAKTVAKSETSATPLKPFTIGTCFCEAAQRWPDHATVIIEACARIVLGKPKNRVVEFRETVKSSSKQRIRTRDGALAYRTHLTGGKLALRLMLWVLKDGTIEFANVGVKAELVIL